MHRGYLFYKKLLYLVKISSTMVVVYLKKPLFYSAFSLLQLKYSFSLSAPSLTPVQALVQNTFSLSRTLKVSLSLSLSLVQGLGFLQVGFGIFLGLPVLTFYLPWIDQQRVLKNTNYEVIPNFFNSRKRGEILIQSCALT